MTTVAACRNIAAGAPSVAGLPAARDSRTGPFPDFLRLVLGSDLIGDLGP